MADYAGFLIPSGVFSYHPVGGGNILSYRIEGTPIYQRVYDSVNTVWCYYYAYGSDPNPAASATTPQHSGTITHHQIL